MPYSEEKANRVINFIRQLKLTKGKWTGKFFTLLPWEMDLIKKTFWLDLSAYISKQLR